MTDTAATPFKADFTRIYDAPDPRHYCETLSQLDYQIPQNALPSIERILAELAKTRPHETLTILDLCCSYGTNALLLNHQLSLQQQHTRYQSLSDRRLTSAELAGEDKRYLSERQRRDPLRVVGLDASEPAIQYAIAANALKTGWAEDLETSAPSTDLAAGIRNVDLILCTGGVGYIGSRTFRRVLDCLERPTDVRIAMFVLRQIDVTPIARCLQAKGLDLRHHPDVSLRQRRFASPEEAQNAIDSVDARGLDPTGKEQDGWYYADLYLSHPSIQRTGRNSERQ